MRGGGETRQTVAGGLAGGAFAIGAVGAARVGGGWTARDCDDLARGQMVAAM